MCGPDTSEAGLAKRMLDEIRLRPHVLRITSESGSRPALSPSGKQKLIATNPDSIAADSDGFAATLSGIALT